MLSGMFFFSRTNVELNRDRSDNFTKKTRRAMDCSPTCSIEFIFYIFCFISLYCMFIFYFNNSFETKKYIYLKLDISNTLRCSIVSDTVNKT